MACAGRDIARDFSAVINAMTSMVASKADMAARIGALDWDALSLRLDADGVATTGPILTAAECKALKAVYGEETGFRSRVVMSRHGFGVGEYKYFAYPLPPVVAALRAALWPHLSAVANRWNEALGSSSRFPKAHEDYLAA